MPPEMQKLLIWVASLLVIGLIGLFWTWNLRLADQLQETEAWRWHHQGKHNGREAKD